MSDKHVLERWAGSLSHAISLTLDTYDTNGEEAERMADALRSIVARHRKQGFLGLCVECRAHWPCPTVSDAAEHLGVRVGGV